MKILSLTGSYRKNGNTAQVMRLVHNHLERIAAEQGVPLELEVLNLSQQQIGYCRGCRACFERGEDRCPVKDDVPAIKARMQAADGLLIATPVYVNDASGLVKSWMDRLAHVCHRPEFAGKCAYAIATTGGSPTGHTLTTLGAALNTWGYTLVGKRGFKTGGLMKAEEIHDRYDRAAQAIAEEFFNAIHQRRFENPSLLSLLTFKIQQLAWQDTRLSSDPVNKLDLAYWQARGWLNPRTEFYFPHRAPRLKVALARLIGAVVARFVL